MSTENLLLMLQDEENNNKKTMMNTKNSSSSFLASLPSQRKKRRKRKRRDHDISSTDVQKNQSLIHDQKVDDDRDFDILCDEMEDVSNIVDIRNNNQVNKNQEYLQEEVTNASNNVEIMMKSNPSIDSLLMTEETPKHGDTVEHPTDIRSLQCKDETNKRIRYYENDAQMHVSNFTTPKPSSQLKLNSEPLEKASTTAQVTPSPYLVNRQKPPQTDDGSIPTSSQFISSLLSSHTNINNDNQRDLTTNTNIIPHNHDAINPFTTHFQTVFNSYIQSEVKQQLKQSYDEELSSLKRRIFMLERKVHHQDEIIRKHIPHHVQDDEQCTYHNFTINGNDVNNLPKNNRMYRPGLTIDMDQDTSTLNQINPNLINLPISLPLTQAGFENSHELNTYHKSDEINSLDKKSLNGNVTNFSKKRHTLYSQATIDNDSDKDEITDELYIYSRARTPTDVRSNFDASDAKDDIRESKTNCDENGSDNSQSTESSDSIISETERLEFPLNICDPNRNVVDNFTIQQQPQLTDLDSMENKRANFKDNNGSNIPSEISFAPPNQVASLNPSSFNNNINQYSSSNKNLHNGINDNRFKTMHDDVSILESQSSIMIHGNDDMNVDFIARTFTSDQLDTNEKNIKNNNYVDISNDTTTESVNDDTFKQQLAMKGSLQCISDKKLNPEIPSIYNTDMYGKSHHQLNYDDEATNGEIDYHLRTNFNGSKQSTLTQYYSSTEPLPEINHKAESTSTKRRNNDEWISPKEKVKGKAKVSSSHLQQKRVNSIPKRKNTSFSHNTYNSVECRGRLLRDDNFLQQKLAFINKEWKKNNENNGDDEIHSDDKMKHFDVDTRERQIPNNSERMLSSKRNIRYDQIESDQDEGTVDSQDYSMHMNNRQVKSVDDIHKSPVQSSINSKNNEHQDSDSLFEESPPGVKKVVDEQTKSIHRTSGMDNEPNYKYISDPVRKKSERQALKGYLCQSCEEFGNAVENGPGGEVFAGFKENLCKCSRHRSKHTPPSTPDGFWELSFKN